MKTIWAGIGQVAPIAPGIYVDAVGNIHLDVAKILAHLGAEDTPENRRRVAEHLVRDARLLEGRAP